MAAERAAIVTGASSGIGLAISRVLAEEGYALTMAARRPEKLDAAVAGLADDGFDVNAVAANLAIALAQAGQRVMIVDCDLRRPRIHTVFNVPQEPGLSNLIVGDANGVLCIPREQVMDRLEICECASTEEQTTQTELETGQGAQAVDAAHGRF